MPASRAVSAVRDFVQGLLSLPYHDQSGTVTNAASSSKRSGQTSASKFDCEVVLKRENSYSPVPKITTLAGMRREPPKEVGRAPTDGDVLAGISSEPIAIETHTASEQDSH